MCPLLRQRRAGAWRSRFSASPFRERSRSSRSTTRKASGSGARNMPQRAQQPIFRPLEQLRAHELVAEQIRRQIALRLVSPGHSLPPERELARLFGVGRTTVQQAIQLLEREQLLESRRGRSGGTFVVGSAQGDETPVGVLDRVRNEREAILEALVFRAELEPAAAAAAAGARGEADLAAMKA